jgi:hypothetical protein
MMTMKMRDQKVFFITAWFSPDLTESQYFEGLADKFKKGDKN